MVGKPRHNISEPKETKHNNKGGEAMAMVKTKYKSCGNCDWHMSCDNHYLNDKSDNDVCDKWSNYAIQYPEN